MGVILNNIGLIWAVGAGFQRRRFRPQQIAAPLWIALVVLTLAAGCTRSSDTQLGRAFEAARADFQQGYLDRAEQRAARQLQRLDDEPRSNVFWSWKFRLLDAEILVRQKRVQEAQALLDKNSATPPTGELTIEWRILRALLARARKQRSDFRLELQVARQLAESSHSPQIAAVLHAEGIGRRDLGDFTGARVTLESSLSAAQREHDTLLTALDLVDIGFTSLSAGRYDEAMLESETAAEFARSTGDRRDLEIALGNAGWAYENLGDFEQAFAHFQVAEREAAAINETASQTRWLEDAAAASYELGDLEASRDYGERALRAAAKLPDDADHLTNIRTNLALVLSEKGNLIEAQEQLDAAGKEAQRSDHPDTRAYPLFVKALVGGRSGATARARGDFVAALNIAEDPDLRTQIEDALGKFCAAEHDPAAAQEWFHAAIESFEQKRESISDQNLRLSVFGYGNRIYRDYADFLISLGHMAQALTVLDESRARTLDEGLRVEARSTVADTSAVAQRMTRKLDSTILFYSLGPEVSHLWAIHGREVRLFTMPGAGVIQTLITLHQHQISRSLDLLHDPAAAARELFRILIQPARNSIPAGSRVFIVPDGPLYGLNFETLVQPSTLGDRYWIEDVAVTVISSIHLFDHATARVQRSGPLRIEPLLLIGDPLSGSSQFQALPNAGDEIRQVSAHFEPDRQTLKIQTQANPHAYVESQPEKFAYIHFVAHGTAVMTRPLDSSVILSPSESDRGDFKLYAHEIVKIPLTAELVTVSACYGAGTRSYASEGLVGLAWAFLRAGAHAVVAALWQVDDASTPVLMGHFYDGLREGAPPDAALRQAKLTMLNAGGIYRKPYYWGTFQVYMGG